MKMLLLVLLSLALGACARLDLPEKLRRLAEEGHYIVINCEIFNLKAKLVSSYPGHDCLFLEDGSFLSYNPGEKNLSKYDHRNSLLWSISVHVHHSLKPTEDGDYLVNSSTVRPYGKHKKVRFDEVLQISKDGEIIKRFSFYENLPAIGLVDGTPYQTRWDKNLDFNRELTHVNASYELSGPVKRGEEVLAPKGSILVSNTAYQSSGAYLLDAELKRIIKRVTLGPLTFHDVQQLSSQELIYFANDRVGQEHPVEPAHIVILNLFSGTEKHFGSFSSIYTGGLQVLDDDLVLVKDSGSIHGEISHDWTKSEGHLMARAKEHENERRRGRLLFYSFKKGVLHEIHFDSDFQHAKIMDLSSFLSKNVGL